MTQSQFYSQPRYTLHVNNANINNVLATQFANVNFNKPISYYTVSAVTATLVENNFSEFSDFYYTNTETGELLEE